MATTKVIKDLTEFNPGNPDYVLNATNAVTVSAASGANKYYFNGVYDGKFGLRIGTTVLTGIPSNHPFTIMNNGKTSQITISGSDTVSGTAPNGDSYTFYYNTATITVLADFGIISYACSVHGYMGGENNLVSVYSEAGLRMPTGGAFSGTPAEGMMRNDTSQSSEGSASTMQHYNGTAWKNFSNKAPIPNTLDYLIVAGGGSGGAAWGGGGGAGGLRTTFGSTSGGGASAENTLTLSAMTYTITVGTGGAAVLGNAASSGNNGTASSLDATSDGLFQTVGGGAGGSYVTNTSGTDGNVGGSGGGGGVLGQASPYTKAGGAGTSNEGFAGAAGGFGSFNGTVGPGGGGGASAVGNAPVGGYRTGGNGGAGLSVEITGTAVTYAGGGGGGSESGSSTGGAGGGGAGGTANTSNGIAGTDGLGAGGGGCGNSGSASRNSGKGGDGVVILRLPTARYSGNTTGSPTVTTVSTAYGTDTILTYTTGGTYVHS